MWRHSSSISKKREKLEMRAKIFARVRRFFDEQDFVEVDTPALQALPGPEPHLTPFVTSYKTPQGETHPLYLHSSPEINCKKLLVAGMTRIYQLSHVFRNAEDSRQHQPEFMLLEWYRVGAGYQELMQDCAGVLRGAAEASGNAVCHYNGMNCDLTKKPEVLTVQDAFKRFAGFDVLETADDPENPAPEKIAAQAKRLGLHVAADDKWDDIALRIIGEKIEPHLGKDAPCFLTDYPLCMAALARPKPSDGRVAERFELYVCGLELANAFVELTDAKIQRARFTQDRALKKERYNETYPVDEAFLKALEQGMPEAGGVALGMDRLVMLATGATHIHEVLWAPVPYTEEK
jgi:lysyl-tRNA synthetase class 2